MKEKTYSITINDNIYIVRLIDKKMKTIRMKVDNNTIIISGYHINGKTANEIISKHEKWIINKSKKTDEINNYNNFDNFLLLGTTYPIIQNGSYYEIGEHHFKFSRNIDYKKEYQKIRKFFTYVIEERVNYYKKVFNHDCNVIYKDMKSKYGYNNPSKDLICLSTRLIHLPINLIDYVIVHEFCHFKVHNHQQAFYDEVSRYYPSYKAARKELKKNSAIMN